MPSKPPTAHGISRLLARAGFKRSVSARDRASSGFRVSKDYSLDDAVRVAHDFSSMVVPRGRREAMLDRYAEAITAAGYSVKADNWGLIVTARED